MVEASSFECRDYDGTIIRPVAKSTLRAVLHSALHVAYVSICTAALHLREVDIYISIRRSNKKHVVAACNATQSPLLPVVRFNRMHAAIRRQVPNAALAVVTRGEEFTFGAKAPVCHIVDILIVKP